MVRCRACPIRATNAGSVARACRDGTRREPARCLRSGRSGWTPGIGRASELHCLGDSPTVQKQAERRSTPDPIHFFAAESQLSLSAMVTSSCPFRQALVLPEMAVNPLGRWTILSKGRYRLCYVRQSACHHSRNAERSPTVIPSGVEESDLPRAGLLPESDSSASSE
jgi:hypothetical protein